MMYWEQLAAQNREWLSYTISQLRQYYQYQERMLKRLDRG
jgi:hypothetical protein